MRFEEGKEMDFINNTINEIISQYREYTERTLAEIIKNYDFVVGSQECKHMLMEILPEEANIIVASQYIENPMMIYAIKKFNLMDLLFEPQERRNHERNN